ncbi:MAG: trimethylamine methyltransferase family protein [Deltaproteobacteria bacterium]|jgi:trimethylamine--corrinoid protein Co-methyltransferase|nr:trimethylamine methyltransferase family protein [Deltaproteobacteria bacterium]
MQRFEILTKTQIEKVHQTSLQILEQIGMDIGYPAALEVLKKGGAKVDGQRVFFPSRLVEAQIKKAPRRFMLHARNPQNNVVVGGGNTVFAPGYGAPFVTDLENGRRKATLQDFENFVKLTGASINLDVLSGTVVEPTDVPYEIRHAQMMYTAMKYSDKCFMGSTMGAQAAKDCIQMAAILFGGRDQIESAPAIVSVVGPLTPLKYDVRMLGALMEYAAAGQPVLIASLAIAGATGPVTLAGNLALQNAEVLAGIVLIQLIREGTPVIFGGASSNAEMRNGTLSIGSPEMAINAAATAQMARYYKLPARSGGAVCDAKAPDTQASYESMMNLLMALVCGANFVLHSAGILESFNCMSYEKFIMDDEMCGMVKRIHRAIDVNPDTLALDVIKAVGPGGHFLDKDHTFDHFRTEFYQPCLANRDDFVTWQGNGSPQSMVTANLKVKEILNNYEVPQLPADADKDLQKFIATLG